MDARYSVIGFVLIVLAGIVAMGCTSQSSGYAPPGPGSPSSAVTGTGIPVSAIATVPNPGQTVSMDLIAKNMAFNTSTISVPAGSQVVIRFHNQESPGSSQVGGIPHNFALYPSPNSTASIFSGAILTGGENITYTFAAPASKGTYYFRCDVHPTVMKGQFIVT